LTGPGSNDEPTKLNTEAETAKRKALADADATAAKAKADGDAYTARTLAEADSQAINARADALSGENQALQRGSRRRASRYTRRFGLGSPDRPRVCRVTTGSPRL
jgi:hypothetical protein